MGWKRLFTLVAVLGLIALTSDIGKTQSKKPIVRLNYSKHLRDNLCGGRGEGLFRSRGVDHERHA